MMTDDKIEPTLKDKIVEEMHVLENQLASVFGSPGEAPAAAVVDTADQPVVAEAPPAANEPVTVAEDVKPQVPIWETYLATAGVGSLRRLYGSQANGVGAAVDFDQSTRLYAVAGIVWIGIEINNFGIKGETHCVFDNAEAAFAYLNQLVPQ
jgi:hypothetical protein